MLQPVLLWTQAPRGQTPIHYESQRHDRILVISAITLSPKRCQFGLYFKIYTHNICGKDVCDFLDEIRRNLKRKITLILDRWKVHKAEVVEDYLKKHSPNIGVEWLPKYAPELNPVEQVWNHSKYVDLANFAPNTAKELRVRVRKSLARKRNQSHLLYSFFQEAGLVL